MTTTKLALWLAAASLCLAYVADAHCGGLHDWSFSPTPTPGKEFVRYKIASCNSWSPVNVSTVVLGALPAFPSVNKSITVRGAAEIWWYMDGNCTDRATTAVTIDANLTLQGRPYGTRQVNGYAFTGSCSNPGDLYRQNVSMGDNRCNLVWWRKENSMTSPSGHLYGGAPNIFISRTPSNTTGSDAPLSFVLFPNPFFSDPVCCDLTYAAPPPASFWTLVSSCSGPAPSHGPSPSNTTHNSTSG